MQTTIDTNIHSIGHQRKYKDKQYDTTFPRIQKGLSQHGRQIYFQETHQYSNQLQARI